MLFPFVNKENKENARKISLDVRGIGKEKFFLRIIRINNYTAAPGFVKHKISFFAVSPPRWAALRRGKRIKKNI